MGLEFAEPALGDDRVQGLSDKTLVKVPSGCKTASEGLSPHAGHPAWSFLWLT